MNNYKRYLSLLLSIILTVSLFVTPLYATSQGSDIEEHWAKGQIEKWIEGGLVTGYPDGSFRPDRGITRAEFVKLVNDVFGYSEIKAIEFSDVEKEDWFYNYVSKAKTEGYITGYKDGTFKPNAQISRQEVAKIIYTILRLKNLDGDMLTEFTDIKDIVWSRDYLNAVVGKGFLGGYPNGTIKPLRAITRAEAIVILDRVVGHLVNGPGAFGPEEGQKTIEDNLTVSKPGVTLQNLLINGDLHLAAGIGEGDVQIKNVIVEGTTIISGGGENSLIFDNTELGEVVIFKGNGEVRVVAKGNTNINHTKVESSAKLQQKEMTGKGFESIEISDVSDTDKVAFDGNFTKIQVKNKSELTIEENSEVDNLQVEEGATGTKIIGNSGVKIKNLIIDSATEILGEGTIEKAVVNTSGIKIAQEVHEIILGESVDKVMVNGEEVTQSTAQTTKSSKPRKTGGTDKEEEPSQPITSKGEAVTDLVLVEKGNNIDSHKLGFFPPESYTSQPGSFQGWLLMYSQSEFNDVWDHITGLSEEEITDYADTAGTNKIYQITNYGWADGLGNTMRAGQKDVVTDAEFGPGLYHFYVATYTSDGIVGLKEANETVDIKPAPRDLEVTGSGAHITDYTVNYGSFEDKRILENFIFYSQQGIYDIQDIILNKTRAEIQDLAAENRGKLVTNLEGPIPFNEGQTEIDGTEFREGLYYVYGATIGNEGILGLSWAKEMIVTAPTPEVPTAPIGDGKGTVLPAGGHTSTSDPDSAEFYDYIRTAAGGGTPRIAIFSSSRDTFDTVYNHYYFDDPTYGALEDNFRDLGFKPVFVPLSIDNAYFFADHPYFADLVKTCDAVFLQGGDQNKHAKALLHDDGTDTEMMKAIRYVYDRGGVVSGTSAGMAVMGEFAYGYGTPDVVLQTNQTESYTIADIPRAGDLFPEIDNNNLTVPGIGLVPTEVLNDTHFDVRGRLGRLVVALRDTGKELGIGADEGTGLAIQNGVGEVVGNHGIFLVDSREATYEPAGLENTFGVTGLKLHYLTAGDKYDFNTKEIIVAEGKTVITEDSEAPLYETENIFGGDYGTTKAIISLAHSDEMTLATKVKTPGEPFFKARFSKGEGTESYTSNLDYVDDMLEDYSKTTIIGMNLDVVEDASLDLIPPVITAIEPASSPYTVYIMITDDKSGIDETTVNQETVRLQSEVNSIYDTSPKYEPDYNDIKVSINEDAYVAGDRITIDGVADLAGNVVETQTWEFDGTAWSRVDVTAPAITAIELASTPYTVYIMITDDMSGIDEATINQKTVTIESEVNSIYNTSPKYEPDYDDIKVSINEDAYVAGDRITIDGVADPAGNVVETQTWEFDGTSWAKVGESTETGSGDTLSNLELSAGDITFDPLTTSYSTTVASAVYEIQIIPTAADGDATITVNGLETVSGAVYNMPLNIGSNIVEIIVTAPDDGSTERYEVEIARNMPSILSVVQSNGGTGARLFLEFDAIGIDTTTLTSSNITMTGNDYWVDEPKPYVDPGYPTEITVEGDVDFVDGNTIMITSNVKDSEGNSFLESTWERVEGTWVKQ